MSSLLDFGMSPSLLDVRFLVLLGAMILLRRAVRPGGFALYGSLLSVTLIGVAAPASLLTIGGVTLLYLWPLHVAMNRLRERPEAARLRRGLFAAGTAGLVLFMVVFKLYQSFTIPFLSDDVVSAGVQQLIGFSYFLFRAINFLYMQYLVEVRLASPAPLLFYTLFPPTLTSGPIHKFLDFRQQVTAARMPDAADYREGIYRITRGYFRKVCLAFLLNQGLTRLLAGDQLHFLSSLAVMVGLYLYFYFDFAGYSDIAIGFGRMVGIRVPENFKQPFLTSTLTEFWRHWHITLVDWLRDHVFIPLGGMRSARLRTSLLALLIMLLCGMWHGLTLSFLLWGLWHGLHLMAEALLGIKPTPVARRGGATYWLKVGWTNLRVAAGALLFLPDQATILSVLRGFVS